MIRFAPRTVRAAVVLAAAVGACACSTPDNRTDSERAADRAITRQIQAALHHAPYLDADHIEVETTRGVVRLSGMVGSDVDLRTALRVSATVPGVRRVVDDLELIEFGRTRGGG